MPDALHIAGPILEVLTWICLPSGLILLLIIAFRRRFQERWSTSEGVVYADASGTGFRWFDHKYRVHNAPMSPHDIKDLAVGDPVLIYYDHNIPSRWQSTQPELRGRTTLILGRILTGIGLAALIAGFILPMF
ncbi:hypothetical protein [Pseudarthrobacter sp. N5]|uniref:hypothetical protein n=1 Tax=Pseudarthrobacter sp. N5 TaxID=3418416 RepID=UPI003CEB786A